MPETPSNTPDTPPDPGERRLASPAERRGQAGPRPDVRQALADAGDLTPGEASALLRVDQRERWRHGEPIPAEEYLQVYPPLQADFEAAIELIYAEYLLREEAGETPALREFELRFPRYAERLRLQVELHRALAEVGLDGAADPPSTEPSAASGAGSEPAGPDESGPDLCGRVLGPYEVLERLGAGGMGQVYKARHRDLDRLVALKVLRHDRQGDAAAVQRFQREIKIVARLAHPNLVLAHDASRVDDLFFLAMEYVEGTDLARLVRQRGPLPVALACEVIRQAALGLQHAHERGLIHRDIKPSNLLLTARGEQVKVLDLGLACWQLPGPDHSSSLLTGSGAVLGTPDFLAPEQARDARQADPRSDLYSLGCTFYYLLTGQVPLPAATLTEKLLRHQMDEPVPVERLRPEVPPEVAAVVRRLMAKRPDERFPSAAAVVEALDRGGTFSTCPTSATVALGKLKTRPYRLRRVGAGALLGLVALCFGTFWWRDTGQPVAGHGNRESVDSGGSFPGQRDRRAELLEVRRRQPGTPAALAAAQELRRLPSPFDQFTYEQIPPHERFPQWQPKELVKVYGEHRKHAWSTIAAIALSPDGKWLASRSEADTIHVWDASTGHERALLKGPRFLDNAGPLVFSPDGTLLAAAYLHDSCIQLWDTDSWTERVQLDEKGGRHTTALAFAPDSKTLVSADQDGVVKVWPVSGGPSRLRFSAHAGGVKCLALSEDGTALATGGNDQLVKVWDVASGRQQGVFTVHGKPVSAVAFAAKGQTLAAVSEDLLLARWDLGTKKPLDPWKLSAQPGRAEGLAFSPDGQTLAWAREQENRIHLAHVATGKEAGSLPASDRCRLLAFSLDGKKLGAIQSHSIVTLWDLAANRQILGVDTGQYQLRTVGLAPDDSRIAFQGPGETVHIVEVAPAAEPTILHGHSGAILTLRFSPDGQSLFSSSENQSARLWNLAAGPKKPSYQRLVMESQVYAESAAFSPDGQTLATLGHEQSSIRLWDVATGQARDRLALPGPHRGLAFSPTGESLLTKGYDGVLRLLEAATGRERQTFDEDPWPMMGVVAFSPDGSTLTSASQVFTTGKLRFWEVASGQRRGAVKDQRVAIYSAAYSPDGRMVATSDYTGRVTLYDPATGDELRQWTLPGSVREAVFSSDSRHLITANGNGTAYVLRLEDAPTGKRAQAEPRTPEGKPQQRRRELLELRRQQPGTPAALEAARELRGLPSPFDRFRREQIPPSERLKWQPEELVAVFGEHRLRTWGTAHSLALSPDGKWLAGGGFMDAIHLWDTTTGHESELLQGLRFLDKVEALMFSPDGKLLASAPHGTEVKLWDTATWKEQARFQGHGGYVRALTFAPDGQSLATASDDGTAKLWSVRGGRPLQTFTAHMGGVRCLAFSRDRQNLATGGVDQTVKVWDTATGTQRGAFTGHRAPLRAVAVAPNGRSLASVSEDLVLMRWDLGAQQPLGSKPLSAKPGRAQGLAFSPDGQTLAWVRESETLIHFTRVATGEEYRFLATPGCCRLLSFSPDGKTLAADNGNIDVALWDMASGQEILGVDGFAAPYGTVALAPDDSWIALPEMRGTIQLCEVASDAVPVRLRRHTGAVHVLQFAADMRFLFSASVDCSARLWDLAARPGEGSGRPLTVDNSQMGNATFSPDGQTLATLVKEETRIKLWNPASGQRRTVIPLPGPHRGLAFSPTGELLASKGNDGVLRLWEVATGHEQRRFQDGVMTHGGTGVVAFAPDGQTLASVFGSFADYIRLWDLTTGQTRATTMRQRMNINSVAFSPDGRLLVSSNENGQITVYEAASGIEVRQWQFPGNVHQVVFSSDSRHLVTANNNGTAYVLRLQALDRD
jgi:WD40 repeat protein/serine/threonine protein kinase